MSFEYGDNTAYIKKDPGSSLPYGFDWTDWLADLGSGIIITDSVWTIELINGDANPLVDSNHLTRAGTITTIDISGGTDGNRYTVKNTITTSSGATAVDTFDIVCEAKGM